MQMVLDEFNTGRSDSYRILSDLFMKAPSQDELNTIRSDFGMESREIADEISTDFQYLFKYPGGILPPVESAFLSSGALSAARVAEFYASAGLEIGEEFTVIPDHISVEFLFMSYLIENRRLDLQKIFLEGHIMNWVPYYCEEIKKRSRTVFYRELAEITKDFLLSEVEDNFE